VDSLRHGTWPAYRCGTSSVRRAKRLAGGVRSAQTLGRSERHLWAATAAARPKGPRSPGFGWRSLTRSSLNSGSVRSTGYGCRRFAGSPGLCHESSAEVLASSTSRFVQATCVRPNWSLKRDLRRQGTWPASRCGPSSGQRAKRLPGYGPLAQTLGLSVTRSFVLRRRSSIRAFAIRRAFAGRRPPGRVQFIVSARAGARTMASVVQSVGAGPEGPFQSSPQTSRRSGVARDCGACVSLKHGTARRKARALARLLAAGAVGVIAA
jgi:hypothetical protein